MRILLLSLIALVAFSCSPESKARLLIEKNLKKTMNDWKSYEFIEMSPVLENYTSFNDTKEEKNLYNKQKDIESRLIRLQMDVNHPTFISKKRYKEIIDSIPIYKQILEDIKKEYETKKKNFKGKFIGYFTIFKFRGKNKFGGYVINEYIFYFDKDLTKIVDVLNTKISN